MKGLEFIATGRALGSKVVTNDDFAKVLDTSDEWIFSRTGIHERHICQDQTNLDLAVEAGRQAMDRAGISPQDVGLCVVATFSPGFLHAGDGMSGAKASGAALRRLRHLT